MAIMQVYSLALISLIVIVETQGTHFDDDYDNVLVLCPSRICHISTKILSAFFAVYF